MVSICLQKVVCHLHSGHLALLHIVGQQEASLGETAHLTHEAPHHKFQTTRSFLNAHAAVAPSDTANFMQSYEEER